MSYSVQEVWVFFVSITTYIPSAGDVIPQKKYCWTCGKPLNWSKSKWNDIWHWQVHKSASLDIQSNWEREKKQWYFFWQMLVQLLI